MNYSACSCRPPSRQIRNDGGVPLARPLSPFDDRELGESKMSFREASGYLVRLRDLYALRWASPRQPVEYQQFTFDDAERMWANRTQPGAVGSSR